MMFGLLSENYMFINHFGFQTKINLLVPGLVSANTGSVSSDALPTPALFWARTRKTYDTPSFRSIIWKPSGSETISQFVLTHFVYTRGFWARGFIYKWACKSNSPSSLVLFIYFRINFTIKKDRFYMLVFWNVTGNPIQTCYSSLFTILTQH